MLSRMALPAPPDTADNNSCQGNPCGPAPPRLRKDTCSLAQCTETMQPETMTRLSKDTVTLIVKYELAEEPNKLLDVPSQNMLSLDTWGNSNVEHQKISGIQRRMGCRRQLSRKRGLLPRHRHAPKSDRRILCAPRGKVSV